MILTRKLKLKEQDLTELNTRIEATESEMEEVLRSVDAVENEEDLQVIEASLGELEERKAELESKRETLELEVEELTQKIQEVNAKKPKLRSGGMEMDKEKEFRTGLGEFVRSKGSQVREGLKTTDVGLLIKPEILSPIELPRHTVVLENLVNRVPVNTGGGKFPIIKRTKNKMNSVAELEKNPELAKPEITQAEYSISTYRGYIPISQEALDDSSFDLTGLIASEIQSQALNTKNDAIAKVLKEAPAKAASGLDGLKDIMNKEIKSYYAVTLVVTQSLYASLDKVKDKEGRYLLQADITSPTGYKFAGRDIYVLPDEVLGENVGDMKAFIGDPKAYVTLFDRLQASVKWVEHNIYGQLLAGFIRFDVKAIDKEAGFYVTYTEGV